MLGWNLADLTPEREAGLGLGHMRDGREQHVGPLGVNHVRNVHSMRAQRVACVGMGVLKIDGVF